MSQKLHIGNIGLVAICYFLQLMLFLQVAIVPTPPLCVRARAFPAF